MPESSVWWAVCNKFNVLPNDPRLAELEPLQLLWILHNMQKDAKELQASTNGTSDTFSETFSSAPDLVEKIVRDQQNNRTR